MPDNIEDLIPTNANAPKNYSDVNKQNKQAELKQEPVVKTPAKVKKHILISNTDYVGIGANIWNSVIRPGIIGIITRAVNQGLNNLFNNNNAPVQIDNPGHTRYDDIFPKKGSSYEYIPAGRVNGNLGYNDLRYSTYQDAEEVINSLCGLINANGYCTVGDLYSLSGVPFDYTKNYYGWRNLTSCKVLEVRTNGRVMYMISFPAVEPVGR